MDTGKTPPFPSLSHSLTHSSPAYFARNRDKSNPMGQLQSKGCGVILCTVVQKVMPTAAKSPAVPPSTRNEIGSVWHKCKKLAIGKAMVLHKCKEEQLRARAT